STSFRARSAPSRSLARNAASASAKALRSRSLIAAGLEIGRRKAVARSSPMRDFIDGRRASAAPAVWSSVPVPEKKVGGISNEAGIERSHTDVLLIVL